MSATSPATPPTDLASERSRVAQVAFELYDFGAGTEVVGSGGWEYTVPAGRTWTRPVFVSGEDLAGAKITGPSVKLTFTVIFVDMEKTIGDVYAVDAKGSLWGSCHTTRAAAASPPAAVSAASTGAAVPSRAVIDAIFPKVIVLCLNASGEPEFHSCTPQVTHQQMLDGYHYALAKENAVDNGYESPMIAFDMTDAAAKQLAALAAWV